MDTPRLKFMPLPIWLYVEGWAFFLYVFASVFTSQWVMLGFMSAGRYMADARAQNLPLIGPGETVQHDWHFVFSQLGWLPMDTLLGGIVQAIGITVGVAGLGFGVYLIVQKLIDTQQPVSRHL